MNIPQEAVEAAAFALDGHSWMTDNEVSLCACGEVLKPSLEYAGDAYRSHLAELALAAAEPHLRRKWAEEIREGVNPPDTGKAHEWRRGFITGVLRTARFLEGAGE